MLDRGYVDFTRLHRLVQRECSFVVRAKGNLSFSCSEAHATDIQTGVHSVQTIVLTGERTKKGYKKKFDSQSPDSSIDQSSAPFQTAPPWPPTPPPELVIGASICEPYRDYVEAQLRVKRNAMSIYQDLVDQFGFTGA